MISRRFFTDTGSGDLDPRHCDTVMITGDEYHHLVKVNRGGCGDPVEAVNGKGFLFYGTIRSIKAGVAEVTVTRRQFREHPGDGVTIAASLIKQRSMAILVEKLTEMGVDRIQPLVFARTDEPFSPARMKKWQKAAAQSLKVNKRLWCTQIDAPVPLTLFLQAMGKDEKSPGTRIVLDIEGQPGIPDSMVLPVAAVVGPPGGITAEERDALLEYQFQPCNISEAVYKTETAAIAAAAIVNNCAVRLQRSPHFL